ncbi:MAG: glycine--tRNA ligase subunit beta [Candidatus Omnitrophica bacterium]|nr:glycine--tRNA ligase subunit beta [Candidatus Omnitrophota bacterium]MCM8829102.1 glycine--tRNA ligase subunit beta [Candidatus Omnitrophota bacterium]
MKTEHLLIEIGCEDLPVWAGKHFIERFKLLFLEELSARRLAAGEIMFFFTNRRLVIFVRDLPSRSAAGQKEVTGPGFENSFDENGQPTRAAIGFARAHGVSISSLKVKNINGRKVVYIVKKIPGFSVSSIISGIFASVMKKIEIPRGMRWNNSKDVFYRPVRWILALYGKQKIDIEFGGIKSSRYTFGHRFLCPQKIKISDWKDYFDKTQKAFVVLGEDLREKFILNLLEKNIKNGESFEKSAAANLANLIEYPSVIRCNFPAVDYTIPEEVLRVLIEKANGVPIFRDGHLEKQFFVVCDGNSSEIVRINYENLLRTRILDAQFFFDSDISITLDEMKKKLDRIVFHQRWGTMAKRVERLRLLSSEISDILGFNTIFKNILVRAAELCKHDLASEMVREFPDLHGTMGAIYARHSGESKDVCEVISRYKYPVYSADPLPENDCAVVLGIIDRLDLICGFIAAGVDVSGSEDPYGLRRTASGFFSLVLKLGIELDYAGIVEKILDAYGVSGQDLVLSKKNIVEFLIQRFESYLDTEGFPKGLRTSVISIDRMDFVKTRKKLNAIRDFIIETKEADAILVPVTRVANILKQANEKGIVVSEFNSILLREAGEVALAKYYDRFSKMAEETLQNGDYSGFLGVISELKSPVDEFFSNVLVMCPQEQLKVNRLSLLKKFNDIFMKFADFSFIREEDIKNVRKN